MSFFSEISHVNFISLTAYIMKSYMSRHRLIRGKKPDRQVPSENEAVDSGQFD